MSTKHRYQVMPDLSPEGYAALKADIDANGVLIPIEVDEEGNIIDGIHRRQICVELGIRCPTAIRSGLSDAQKRERAWRLNLMRRHLTQEQKREIAFTVRKERWTQERIAQYLGVSQSTISNWLQEFSNSGKLPHPSTVQGRDGKRYPSTKTRRRAAQATKRASMPDNLFWSDTDARSAQETEPSETTSLRGTNPESRSPCEGVIVASGTAEPPEMPPPATDKFQGAAREQPNSAQGALQVPPAGYDAEEYWVGALKDLSERLETLQSQGGLPLLSTRWPPETRAQCVVMIQRMQKILSIWEAVGGREIGETTDRDGHDDDVMPPAVPPPIAHAAQEHGKRKLVTVSSAEDPIGDMTDDDQQHPPLSADGKLPSAQVLPPQQEETPWTQDPVAVASRSTQAADQEDSLSRARIRPSKRTVANGHGSGTPVRTTPHHPTPDDSQSTGEGVTVGIPVPHDDDQAVEPVADAAQPISVLVPAHHGDSVPGDPTRCGYCGNTQSFIISKDSGKIFCRCHSVYRPSTGCWHARKTAREQHPPAPPPATAA